MLSLLLFAELVCISSRLELICCCRCYIRCTLPPTINRCCPHPYPVVQVRLPARRGGPRRQAHPVSCSNACMLGAAQHPLHKQMLLNGHGATAAAKRLELRLRSLPSQLLSSPSSCRLHILTDGRDVPDGSSLKFVEELEGVLKELAVSWPCCRCRC